MTGAEPASQPICPNESGLISDSLKTVAKYYTVLAVKPSDRPELISFFKAAYADQFNSAEYRDEAGMVRKLEWLDAAAASAGIAGPISWICRDNLSGRIVGHFGTMPVKLKCRDGYRSAAWGRDLVVLPEYRKIGVGPYLVHSILKDTVGKGILFLIAGVRDHVYKMYKRFGFKDMGFIPLCVRVNRLEKIVCLKTGNMALAVILSVPGRLALQIFYAFCRVSSHIGRRRAAGTKIEEIARFDDSFDALWKYASTMPGIMVRRDSAYLNWRFVDQPCRHYRIFKATREGSGYPSGYIVLREGMSLGLGTGVISDVFSAQGDRDVKAAMIEFAVSYFEKRDDVDLVRCDVLDKTTGSILRGCGFINAPSRERFMLTNTGHGPDAGYLGDRDNWFLDYSDSDLDLSGR